MKIVTSSIKGMFAAATRPQEPSASLSASARSFLLTRIGCEGNGRAPLTDIFCQGDQVGSPFSFAWVNILETVKCYPACCAFSSRDQRAMSVSSTEVPEEKAAGRGARGADPPDSTGSYRLWICFLDCPLRIPDFVLGRPQPRDRDFHSQE